MNRKERETFSPRFDSLGYREPSHGSGRAGMCFVETDLAAGAYLAGRGRKMTLRMEGLEAKTVSKLLKLSWGEVINSAQLLAGVLIAHICNDEV